MSEVYYVYVHRKLSDNSIFYVGKGCNGRYKDTNGRNLEWWSVVFKENGFQPSIYQCGLTEEDALEKETKLIQELDSSLLTNISLNKKSDLSLDIGEIQYEETCDKRLPKLKKTNAVKPYQYEIKRKESNLLVLDTYFQYNPNSVIPVKDFKEFIKVNNLKGLSRKSTNFISATKVAKYFNQKYKLPDVLVKNIRVKDLKKTCTCVIGLEFKNV